MTQRRNNATTILFLLGLLVAAVYLFTGALTPSGKGFRRAYRPTRSDHSAWAPAHRTQVTAHPIKRPGLTPLDTLSMDKITDFIDNAEPSLNATLDRDYHFIELYGASQRLQGRRIVEDVESRYTVAKLDDGSLTFADPNAEQVDMTVRAQEMIEFVQRIEEESDAQVLYIQAPSKLSMGQLPDGAVEHSDAEADQFLSLIEDEVDTLDLRPAFQEKKEQGHPLDEYFFRTDHHWTPAGAFLGFQTLADKLREDYDYTIYPEITNPDYYNKYTFTKTFLGSQGKRVGSYYAGMDDLQVWSPKFNSNFTYSVPMNGIERSGPFAVSLLFPELLASDDSPYIDNPYIVYSGGDFLMARTVNEVSPYPWGRRVLVLRDSFGCAFTPFLSIISGEVITIDPRLFDGDQEEMMEYLEWADADIIMILNTTSSLRSDEMFPYLPTARANVLEEQRQKD